MDILKGLLFPPMDIEYSNFKNANLALYVYFSLSVRYFTKHFVASLKNLSASCDEYSDYGSSVITQTGPCNIQQFKKKKL